MSTNESAADTMKRLATTQKDNFAPIGTVRGMLQHRLYSMGLFDDQVLAISKVIEADPANEVMHGHWDDQASDYSEAMLFVGWAIAKQTAADWLKKNQPLHWALPLFEKKPDEKTP